MLKEHLVLVPDLQDGSVQVHVGVVPQEAERRDALLASHSMLAIPSARSSPQGPEVHQARQGQEARVQEQAG